MYGTPTLWQSSWRDVLAKYEISNNKYCDIVCVAGQRELARMCAKVTVAEQATCSKSRKFSSPELVFQVSALGLLLWA